MKQIPYAKCLALLAMVLPAVGLGWNPTAAATATEVEPGSSLAVTGQPTPNESAEGSPVEPASSGPAASGEAVSAMSTLSLDEALSRAVAAHPGLAALDKEYWALDSIAWQEGRRPNPALELELEEFGGTEEALGVRAMETSLTYIQPLERGGKREKRETAASLERELVLWDIAELEHAIQADVRTAFSAAQAAQYELKQLREYRELVQRIHDTVAASVEAGRSARLELERFEIELARLDLELAAAERAVDQALLELSGLWGANAPDFAAVGAAPDAPDDLSPLARLQPLLESHPALARFDAEYEVLCALLDLEHANAVGDMELFGGVSRLNEINETVFRVGVAWDLTTNDRNEGNISAAAQRLEQLDDRRAAVRLELEAQLASLHSQAASALAHYQAYTGSLLPAANEALELTEEGYRYGKFELLDVLDAQRTVVELKREQAAALNELTGLLAQIEALLNLKLIELAAETATDAAATHQSQQPEQAVAGAPAVSQEHEHE